MNTIQKLTPTRMMTICVLAIIAGMFIVPAQQAAARFPGPAQEAPAPFAFPFPTESPGAGPSNIRVNGDGCSARDVVCLNRTAWHLKPQIRLSGYGEFWHEYQQRFNGRWNVQMCKAQRDTWLDRVYRNCSEPLFEQGVPIDRGYRCSFGYDRGGTSAIVASCSNGRGGHYSLIRTVSYRAFPLVPYLRSCLYASGVGVLMAANQVSELSLPAGILYPLAACGGVIFLEELGP